MKLFRNVYLRCFLVALLLLVNIPFVGFAEGEEVILPTEFEELDLEIDPQIAPPPNPALEIISATANKSHAWPGDTVKFTFVVHNNGNIDLDNVNVIDDLTGKPRTNPGNDEYVFMDGTDYNDSGDTRKFEHYYVVPDAARGIITNGAYAEGTWVKTGPDPKIQSTKVEPSFTVLWPDIDLEKTVDTTEAFYGETIEYTFTVENTGTVPLYDVHLEDQKLDYDFTWSVLTPGAVEVKTVPYLVPCMTNDARTSDIEIANSVSVLTNCAVVTGYLMDQMPSEEINIDCIKPPKSVTDTSCVTVNLKEEKLALQLTKHVYDEEIGIEPVEAIFTPEPQKSCLLIDNNQEFVYYYFDLYNSGDAPLHDIVINDNQLGDAIILDDFLKEEVILQPGQSITVGPVPFLVKAVTTWPLVNKATAFGEGYCHDTTSNESSTCVNLASILLDKTVNPTSALVGNVVSYTLKITNIGSVDLYNIELSDNKIAYSTIVPELKAGFTTTFIVPYTVKAEDVGEFVNIASVIASTCNHQETTGQVIIDYVPCMTVNDTDDAVLTVTTPAIPPITPPEEEEEPTRRVVVIPPVETPLAAPATEAPTEPEIVPEEVVPLAPVVLPKTGELPATLFYSIGALISGLGVFLKRR